MDLEVNGARIGASTGGRPIDTAKPLLLFVHGASQDRTIWAMQTRYFSHHGWSVLAADFPAHGRSGGQLLTQVEQISLWLGDLIAAAGYESATIVGHSLGSLAALDLAATQPERVVRLVLCGTSAPMMVHPALQAAADANQVDAYRMIQGWSLASRSSLGGHPTPGLWMHGSGLRTSLNAGDDRLAAGLRASNDYTRTVERAADIQCPTLIICGAEDRMANPKGAKVIAEALPDGRTVTIDGAGHSMMIEKPDAFLDALIAFLG